MDKILGLDGLPMESFLGCYEFIEEDLKMVVETTKNIGKILGVYNTTFISLISKEENLTSFKKFRLISLCNYKYKIISKVIARILKKILPKQVLDEKFRFLEG